MAEKVVSPGVFTNEIDASFLPAAIGEIGAAIIGPTVKGPALTPVVVSSFSEYESMFGTTFKSGSGYYQYLTSYAVKEYLKNAGKVTVCRILAGAYSKAYSEVSSSITSAGDAVATKKDRNSNDCEKKSGNKCVGIIIPTNKLFEKSGLGKRRRPPINPIMIDMYAVFSFRCLL